MASHSQVRIYIHARSQVCRCTAPKSGKAKSRLPTRFSVCGSGDVSVLAAVARDVDSSWPSVLDGGIGTAPDDDYRYIIAMSASKTQANFVSMGSL